MFSENQMVMLCVCGIIVGALIVVRLLATAMILFAKIPENHFSILTTIGGSLVSILWNNRETYLQDDYEATPCPPDFDNNLHGEGLLAKIFRRDLDAWWIGILTLPFIKSRTIMPLKIRRKRFREQGDAETPDTSTTKDKDKKPNRTGTIADMIEIEDDETKNTVSAFKIIDTMPMAFFRVETRDNFLINVLLSLKWRVTNPRILAMEIGTEKFFDNFETAVSDVVKRFVIGQNHKEYFENVNNQVDKGGTEKEGNDVLLCKIVMDLNERLKRDFGCEIVSVYVRAYDQDKNAIKGVQAITDARNRKEAKVIDADGDLYAAQKAAEGEAAEALAFVGAFNGDARLAAHVLGRKATPGLLVEGGGSGVQPTLQLSQPPSTKSTVTKTTEKPKEKPADEE